MANLKATDFQTKQTRLGVNGGAIIETFEFAQPNVANGDKIYLGVLDAGVLYTDVKLVFDDCGVAPTLTLGYEPYNHADFVANNTYWLPATDVFTAAGAVVSKAQPIEFTNKVALVATVGGGAFTGTPKITAVVTGNGLGYK
jgi:hypothetical protein